METKICKKCDKEKDICEFSLNKYCKDGFLNRCKECCESWRKKYEEKNKEKIKEQQKCHKLCDYTNLQPLWANENYKKGNKI